MLIAGLRTLRFVGHAPQRLADLAARVGKVMLGALSDTWPVGAAIGDDDRVRPPAAVSWSRYYATSGRASSPVRAGSRGGVTRLAAEISSMPRMPVACRRQSAEPEASAAAQFPLRRRSCYCMLARGVTGRDSQRYRAALGG